MAETPTDVLVAGYQEIDEATKDFESLVALVRDKQVSIEGVILVTHAQDGSVAVRQTGDNLGRKGLGWGGGVGLAVGLFAPPLLASVAVGAVAGGVIGKFVDHRVEQDIHDKIGENLPPGSAGIIAVFDDEQRLGVEQALPGAMIRSVVQGDKQGTAALKESLAEAMGKFSPDRTVLPIPDPNFGGTVGRTLDMSVADWTINMTPSAPEGAPNVLLVLIDDAGFGNPSTFGGPVSTPSMTRVGEQGLTYNRFHVTALCSPSRAALLTGRNHHTVGFGSIGELPGPFPGYTASRAEGLRSVRPGAPGQRLQHRRLRQVAPDPGSSPGRGRAVRPLAERVGIRSLLGDPRRRGGSVRPRDHPGQHDARRPEGHEDGKAVLLARRPDRPGSEVAAHRPGSGPDETLVHLLLDRVRARAASGGDGVEREVPWPVRPGVGRAPRGDLRTAEEAGRDPARRGAHSATGRASRRGTRSRRTRRGCTPARWRYTPATRRTPTGTSDGCSTPSQEMGELDNTLVFYIFGDNGASMEGTITGSFNELTMQNGIALTPEQQLSLIDRYGGLDAWGTDAFAPHYASAWAWAGNAPFQWGKQVASHLGGTRNGMVISWPERIRDAGGLRSQFTHCIDLGPTILEAAGIPEPKMVDGIAQKPMEGTSFLYSFDDASAAERHTVQYFEIYGNRAIYKDGWWAACMLDRIPWDASPPSIARFAPGTYDPEQDSWELYYLPDDFTQANDLAAEHPDKLAELKELFWEEAERHNVLPLMAGFSVFFGILPPMPTITTHTFYGDVENIASGMIPRVYGHSYAIEAELSVPEHGAEGVIVAEADEMGGFSLWVDDQGLLHHSYSMMGVEHYQQVSTEPIPTGDITVRMQFDADRQERSAGGMVSLYANDQLIGEGRLEKTVFLRFSAYAEWTSAATTAWSSTAPTRTRPRTPLPAL